MGLPCAVMGCKNMYGRGMSRGMSFHRFPSKKDPVLRELCINVTGQRNVNKNWMPSYKSKCLKLILELCPC